MGELDIVARGTGTPERHAGTVIVFVEVRYRSRADFGGAAASIDSRKQAKLLRAARAWIQQNDPREQFQYRFDVVTVAPGSSGQPAIDWLQAAISET